jgi:hypothetical protein
MKHASRLLAYAACFAIIGCQDSDPLAPIVSPIITMTVNSMNGSDIESGIIDKDENISTETGNPWGEFMSDAVDQCGGDPVGFEVAEVSLELDRDGSDIESLDEVFSDSASVILRSTQGSDADADQVVIGSGMVQGAGGTFNFMVPVLRAELAVIHDRLVGGDFHVAVRGATHRQRGDDFSMDVRVSFGVRTFCD